MRPHMLLQLCREQGIELWVEDDLLHYDGPETVVQPLLGDLKIHKTEIIELLRTQFNATSGMYFYLRDGTCGVDPVHPKSREENLLTWRAIDSLAKELERHGLSSQEALKRAHHEITQSEVPS